jgi:N-methylhydantoinase A
VGRYVGTLRDALAEREFSDQLLLMGSNGGVLSMQHAALAPVLLVESGPVGGCIGAGAYGAMLGIDNLVAFDMGGTTAKCALVRKGAFDIETTYHIGGYGRGIPVRVPVVDIVEVGAGGGSIAWLDKQGQLGVGPQSAGSSPGPVAYGLGGREPTVTDANLVLGRLASESFQGGEMALDAEACRRALAERLAAPLGYEGESGLLELAGGIVTIASVKMSEAIKRITIQRGMEASDFSLFAYGGGGPLHAAELARNLGIPLVIIPPEAGNFSAVGMLLADLRMDDSQTFVRRLEDDVITEMDSTFHSMEESMRQRIAEHLAASDVSFERVAEMRYVGQYHAVRVPAAERSIAALETSFHRIYHERYGHAPEGKTEIVSLHSTAVVESPKPGIPDLATTKPKGVAVSGKARPVYFPETRQRLETSVFSRHALPIGFRADGPALIEEYGSTTLVGPLDRFEIGALGEIRISIEGARG